MSASDNGGVVVCGYGNCFDDASTKVRERFERIDGPYEPINCSACNRGCLIGRWGRQQLETGNASKVICVECLMKAVDALNQDDEG